ncbi:hypothetical protein [uncultured Hyphomicrobium sp.]|uniref:hypothetical protein n=1 Tax=uncultured Hyphomicrobium sp. TaxID=194373 RepID=UPI0025F70D28|nr:hypothetical protein [uncultured Hyphomicrobium sp.]
MRICRTFASLVLVLTGALLGLASAALAQSGGTFRVNPPGVLKDGYGEGVQDYTLYAPGARFPIDAPTTTLNSQLRNPGGMFYAGSECSGGNYDETWWDTYCEKRSGKNRASLCKSNAIHQGLDIRGGSAETCAAMKRGKTNLVPVVAVYDGDIFDASGYTVKLRTDRGVFSYLHLNMNGLAFRKSDLPLAVKAGQLIGYMDNDFGKVSTTYHLHLEHRITLAGKGTVPVPLYCDMVLAYERDRGKKAVMVGGGRRCDGGVDPVESVPTDSQPPQPATDEVAEGPKPEPKQPPPTSGSGTTEPAIASRWMHNGSEMGLVSKGDEREFVYLKPRSSLGSLVQPGTVLFSGRKVGDSYEGKAKVFKSGCEPTPYEVKGPVQNEGKTVVLRGVRLIPDDSCKVARQYNDTLVFQFSGDAGGGAEAPEQAQGQGQIPAPDVPPPDATVSSNPAEPETSSDIASGAASLQSTALTLIAASQCKRLECVDRAAFMAGYGLLYKKLQGKELNAYQVAALNSLLNVWDTVDALKNPLRLAYILATVYHESFHLIYPIRECKCTSDAGSIACVKRLYDKGKASAYHLRDRKTHQSYYGRGQTQLTLKDNFLRIGRNLGLPVDIVANPDEALRLDVSARNAVLGLYEGWYRAPRNSYCKGCWLGLKNIPFLSDFDWLAARDVLISQRRHSDRVAEHGKQIAKLLKFISRAEFDRKYGTDAMQLPQPSEQPPAEPPPVAGTGSPPMPPPSEPPAPVADTTPPPPPKPAPAPVAEQPPPVPPPAPVPAPVPGPDRAAIAKLAADARRLEENVGDVESRARDLSKEIVALRAALEVLAGGAQVPAAVATRSAFDEVKSTDLPVAASNKSVLTVLGVLGAIDPLVDFITRWPPDHKPHAWCKAPGDKSVADDKAFDGDEEGLFSHYGSDSLSALPPLPVGGSAVKSGEDTEKLVLRAPPLVPAVAGAGRQIKSSDSAPGTWWTLPRMPRSVTIGKIAPLAPAIVESAPSKRL